MDQDKTKELLEIHQRALNRIQDFFEYRNESKSDRQYVHQILEKMCDECEELFRIKGE